MKNIFKFMGIALMACSLMVACGPKDDPEQNDTTPQEAPIPDGVSFTFDGVTTTNWAYTDASYYDEYSQFYLMYLISESSYLGGFQCWINAAVADQSLTADAADNFALTDQQTIEYWKEHGLTNEAQTAIWGDYWTKTANINVKAFDMTALTVTAKFDGVMFSAYDVYLNGVAFASAPTAPFAGTIGNLSLTAASK
jgi:hypothetical protein